MKDILINHTQGVRTLEEIQEDVKAFRKKAKHYNDFGFTSLTVQALIDKINDLTAENKDLKEQLEIAELEREQQETEADIYYKHLNNSLMYIPESNSLHTEVLQALGGKYRRS